MIENSEKVNTIEYNAVMSERIKGKMVVKKSFFKINTSPVKIYVRQSFIGIKLDALYVEGTNNNKLLIATIGFPWIQVSLDPKGKRVRENHHHTIFEAGFTYFSNVIEAIIKSHPDDIKIELEGSEIKDGKDCYKIVLYNNNFQFIEYTVQENENLTTIAKRMYTNDYMILENNPKIENYNDVKPGQVIKIPNSYASKMVLYLDKTILMPVQIDIFDNKGLYGSYSYNNLQINKQFEWDEFSPTNKNYHFR
jgi:LysM repeat protein